MSRNGDGAFVKLHSKTDPVSSLNPEGLLQNNSCLLPVRVPAEGAHADFLVQVDLVPEGNRCNPASWDGLHLWGGNRCLIWCCLMEEYLLLYRGPFVKLQSHVKSRNLRYLASQKINWFYFSVHVIYSFISVCFKLDI